MIPHSRETYRGPIRAPVQPRVGKPRHLQAAAPAPPDAAAPSDIERLFEQTGPVLMRLTGILMFITIAVQIGMVMDR